VELCHVVNARLGQARVCWPAAAAGEEKSSSLKKSTAFCRWNLPGVVTVRLTGQ
jgi:hypothetical protein